MTLSPADRGLTLGDGLFETVLADAGTLAFWDEHMDRLARGCAVLDLPPPDREVVRRQALDALAKGGLQAGRAALRLSWTAGPGGRGLDRPERPAPQLVVTASAAPLPVGAARLVTVSIRRNETSPASRLKTLSYLDNVLARREAAARGADEALMLNMKDEVAGAAAANIFWVEEGGKLCTPALSCGVLDGIMRARVMGGAGITVAECRASLESLKNAKAVFLTNSLIGVRRVSQIDEQACGGEMIVQGIAARL